MTKRPQDMLEFFRRSTADPEPAIVVQDDPDLEETPRLLLVRRSQILIASAATLLAVILAFVLGMAAGGDEEPPVTAEGVGGWVIRVISYKQGDNGLEYAKSVMGDLEKLGWGEVTLQQIPSKQELVVTLGSWVHHPTRYKPARQLLDRIKKMDDKRTGRLPFEGAYFWRIGR